MTTKIPVELSSTPSIVDNGDATAITIDSSENVGIGETSPDLKLHVKSSGQIAKLETTASTGDCILTFADASANKGFVGFGSSSSEIFQITNIENGDMKFDTNNTERMRITSSGNVGIGTTSPANKLHLEISGNNGAFADADNPLVLKNASTTDGATVGQYFGCGNGIGVVLTTHFPNADTNAEGHFAISTRNSSNSLAERMRIDSSGNVMVGTTNVNIATQNSDLGIVLSPSGRIFATGDGHTDLNITSDGEIIRFRSGATQQGNITISGALVFYNGFSGTHESSGIASNTAIGTVCSTIDELDTYLSGNKEGQTRTDHAKIKVSDTEGDSRVYGVLSSYSEEDNKPIVASVGIGSVLVTGACAGGDLLESNGDGTAKVQDDDIIRSKTIGKVTIGNSNTDVKLVSCVLYCG